MMSTQSSNNSKRIAKNTLLPHALYDGVSLHTSRVILNALGVEDLGIYNMACGVVAI